MKIKYLVVKENLILDTPYTAYGILILQNQIPTHYISDVFTDLKSAEKYIDMFNTLKLNPIHIYEILEDIL